MGDAVNKVTSAGGQVASFGEGVVGNFTGENARKAAEEQDKRFREAAKAAEKAKVTSSGTVDGTTTTDQTSQTTFDPKGRQERTLEKASVSNFIAQNRLAQDAEKDIAARQGLEQQARGTLGDITSGDAFELSQGEQGRIDRLTEAGLARGDDRINRLLNERLAGLEADAASRGLRGQAFTQLQSGALDTAAQEATTQQLAAEERAAQLGIQLPGQRVAVQAQTAGGLATFADQARQQAIQNRQALQDPVLLQQLRDERLRSGKTQTTGGTTTSQTTTDETTGAGVAGILQAQAQAPGPQSAKSAGVSSGIGQAIEIGKIAAGT